ncbi:MAG: ATP-dependent zinc metalloprotease FtsH [bacterium]
MKNLFKNFGWGLLFIIIVATAFSFFQSPVTQPEKVPLSNVVERIKNNEVDSLVVEGSTKLLITLKDGTELESQKEAPASIVEALNNYGINKEQLGNLSIEIKSESGAVYWLTELLPFLLPFLFLAVFIYFIARSVSRGNNKAMSFGSVQNKQQENKTRNRITFKDVAGIKEAKEELYEVVDFLKNAEKFSAVGARIPKGVLLMGPPGCGKTLLARAVAGEAKVPFFHISGSEFVEMFVGVGASRVRDLFNKAKKNAPAILFVDEIDAVGRQRGAGLGGSHDEREQTLNQILVEMDGFDTNDRVIVIAATNRPDVLDPALLRPGRFDRRVVINNPDIKERIAILKIHSRKKPLGKDVDLKILAQRTPGFTGADLNNLLNEAAILAARDNRKTITMNDCIQATEKVMMGPERRSHVLDKHEKKIAAYHEAGHALVAHFLPYSDPVHKISIISRGQAAGYTLKLPEGDKSFHSRKEFLDDLAVTLGGYVTEKLVFSDLTTGPSSDLRQATNLARRLVKEFGMSEKLGPITFGDKEEMIFLGREIHDQRNYSEEVASNIDKEINILIQGALHKAEKIIKKHGDILENIVKELLEKETLERKEFEAIVGTPKIKYRNTIKSLLKSSK